MPRKKNMDAIALLKADHRKVEGLFGQFEKAKDKGRKRELSNQICLELRVHAQIEEDIFYPTVRQHVGKDLMNEADEEHHVARVLIAELDNDGRDDDHRYAKFTVLAESVRHHIKEEENEMLPKAKDLKLDFAALGTRMLQRKQELKENGIPLDAEHAMVAAAGAGADTPARAAHRRRPASRRTRARRTPVQRTRAKRNSR